MKKLVDKEFKSHIMHISARPQRFVQMCDTFRQTFYRLLRSILLNVQYLCISLHYNAIVRIHTTSVRSSTLVLNTRLKCMRITIYTPAPNTLQIFLIISQTSPTPSVHPPPAPHSCTLPSFQLNTAADHHDQPLSSYLVHASACGSRNLLARPTCRSTLRDFQS